MTVYFGCYKRNCDCCHWGVSLLDIVTRFGARMQAYGSCMHVHSTIVTPANIPGFATFCSWRVLIILLADISPNEFWRNTISFGNELRVASTWRLKFPLRFCWMEAVKLNETLQRRVNGLLISICIFAFI